MKPLDPRLLRYARRSRSALALGGVIGFLQTLCTVGFAWLVATIVDGAIAGEPIGSLVPLIGCLAAVVLLRGGFVWATDAAGARAAAVVKSELRLALVSAVTDLGPAWVSRRSGASLATLIGRGMDALDDYFAKYIPQLILTLIATPMIVAVVAWFDLISAVIIVITLPLIPVFMALIGWATQAAQQRQWATLGRLSSGFADSIGGLATLKIFGRQTRLIERMQRISREYRFATIKVLRVSFLSSFALELAASLSVAIVAVTIGMRLIDGQMPFAIGLFVLLLAPEAFLPLRQVGANFHAAAEGLAAAQDAFDVLDEVGSGDAHDAPDRLERLDLMRGDRAVVELVDVTVDHGDGLVVGPLNLTARAAELTVITGPSGVGKSTAIQVINGFVPASGLVRAAPRERTGWSPQKPSLVAGSVRQNVALGVEAVDEEVLARSMAIAAADDVSVDQIIGVHGTGVSGGQAQRLSIARAVYRVLASDGELIMLDEPSSALDHRTEASLIDGLRELTAVGIAVLVVSHRQSMIDAADRVVRMDAHGRAGICEEEVVG
ncbi:hypothetical protein GCM10027416_15470 [Okibacterium endophyticum]